MRNLFMIILVTGLAGLVMSGCRPKHPNCKKDSHCNDGEYCVNNLCQQCRDNGDCPEGSECSEGGCREIPGYCSQSSDCSQGQVCRDKVCGPCMEAGDCGDGTVCMDGLCGVPECNTIEDCPAGTSCVNYRCTVTSDSTSGIGDGNCSIETVFFDFDSSELSSEGRNAVEANYHCLNERGGKVVLVGHCDSRGTTEYNLALGERRARMVTKILVNLGMDRSRVRVSSKGEEEASGVGDDGMSRDRRVEFK